MSDPNPEREGMIDSIKRLQAAINAVDVQREQLLRARRKAMVVLHRTHGASLREIGGLCGVTATAVASNLARYDAEAAEAAEAVTQ